MQATKWLVGFILLIGLGLGGFSLVVAAATAPFSVPNEPATLEVDAGKVEIKHAETGNWTNATNGMTVIVGDSIKTDATGEASVNLFDQGTIRLDHDTEITITSALWDANNPDVFNGSIFLTTGRLWSRLFDFISPDSSFNVSTDSTVATVRGTVFSVSALPSGETWVYVDDHTVNVKTPTSTIDVTSGQNAQIAKHTERTDRFIITKKDLPDNQFVDWITNNRKRDADFERAVQVRWKKKLLTTLPFSHIAETLRLTATLNKDAKAIMQHRLDLRTKMLDRLTPVEHKILLPNIPLAPTTDHPLQLNSTATFQLNGVPLETKPRLN